MSGSAVAYGNLDTNTRAILAAGWASQLDRRNFEWAASTEVLERLVCPFRILTELCRLMAQTTVVIVAPCEPMPQP